METGPSGAAGKRAARRIKQLRMERSLTQTDLAERLVAFDRSYTVSTLSRIEQGKRRLDIDDLVAIAAALDVSLDTLLLEDRDPAQAEAAQTSGDASVADAGSHAWPPLLTPAINRPQAFTAPSARRSGEYGPWSSGQIRVVGSWSDRRDEPVSVALSPAGDRLALAVGQRLSVSDITDSTRVKTLFTGECALTPRAAWSLGGDRLAYRDETGLGRLVELPASGAAPKLSILGPVIAVAFTPDRDELAVLAPSLPGRVTLMLMRAQGDVLWRQELARDSKSSYYSEGTTWPCRPTGACWPVARERRRSGCSTPPPGSRCGSSTITRGPSPASAGSTTNGYCPPPRTRRCGYGGRTTGPCHRRGDHRGGGNGVRARPAHRAGLVGPG
jgi:transcriptional regulator with XRE-family HTH domain